MVVYMSPPQKRRRRRRRQMKMNTFRIVTTTAVMMMMLMLMMVTNNITPILGFVPLVRPTPVRSIMTFTTSTSTHPLLRSSSSSSSPIHSPCSTRRRQSAAAEINDVNNSNNNNIPLLPKEPTVSTTAAASTSTKPPPPTPPPPLSKKKLQTYLRYLEVECWKRPDYRGLEPILQGVANACQRITRLVQRAQTDDIYGVATAVAVDPNNHNHNPPETTTTNIQGEVQQKLDVLCNTILLQAFCGSGREIYAVASEEEAVPQCCAAVMVRSVRCVRFLWILDGMD